MPTDAGGITTIATAKSRRHAPSRNPGKLQISKATARLGLGLSKRASQQQRVRNLFLTRLLCFSFVVRHLKPRVSILEIRREEQMSKPPAPGTPIPGMPVEKARGEPIEIPAGQLPPGAELPGAIPLGPEGLPEGGLPGGAKIRMKEMPQMDAKPYLKRASEASG